MIPSVALGELLMIAAVPAAAALAIVAAILARRHKRLARTLAGLALAVLVGMVVTGRRLSQPLSELRLRQTERFASLETGWSREQVARALGPPDLECPGEGAYVHQVQGTQQLLLRLYASTTERWIYFAPGAPPGKRPECRPRYADGEVGFNAAGRVIWYIELTDEAFLKF